MRRKYGRVGPGRARGLGRLAGKMSLRFVTGEYPAALTEALCHELKVRGFCVLPDVYERDSVTAFEAVIRSKAGPGALFDVHAQPITSDNEKRWWLPNDAPELVEPIRAPRIRSFLKRALIPAKEPRSKIQVFEAAWLVDPGDGPGHWHQDYPHSGEPGQKLEHYLYPENIYVACYFRDMAVADGPTQVIPGSHVVSSVSPVFSQRMEFRRLYMYSDIPQSTRNGGPVSFSPPHPSAIFRACHKVWTVLVFCKCDGPNDHGGLPKDPALTPDTAPELIQPFATRKEEVGLRQWLCCCIHLYLYCRRCLCRWWWPQPFRSCCLLVPIHMRLSAALRERLCRALTRTRWAGGGMGSENLPSSRAGWRCAPCQKNSGGTLSFCCTLSRSLALSSSARPRSSPSSAGWLCAI